MPLTSRSVATAGVVAATALALPCVRAHAQVLDYQRTTMVHGLGGSSRMWRVLHPTIGRSTADYLEQVEDVALKSRSTPELTANTRLVRARLPVQRQTLADFLAVRAGRSVMVGHSMGSLVSRSLYIDAPDRRPQVAGIIAVTAPHQGADIAVNAPRGAQYFLRLEGRVNEALDEINQNSMPLTFYFLFEPKSWESALNPRGVGRSQGLMQLLRYNFGGQNLGEEFAQFDATGALALIQEPGLPDLAPTDPKYPPANFPQLDFSQIRHLNESSADNQIPRANVVAEFTATSKIPIRLLLSMLNREYDIPNAVASVNAGIHLFDGCVKISTFLMQKGRKRDCRRARRLLENMDHEWNKVIKGSDTTYASYRIFGMTRTVSAERARAGATDGVVPNSRSRYPGLNDPTAEFLVRGRNHVNVYKHGDGLHSVADAMRRISMGRYSQQPDVPFESVVFEGPQQITAGVVGQWSVQPIGGRSPFTYRWYLSGESLCAVINADACINDHMLAMKFPEGPVQITVDVTDANLAYRSTGLLVFVGAAPVPMRATVTAPAELYARQTGTWTATVTGGTPPYRYDWSTGVTATVSSASYSIGYVPTVQGLLQVNVTVTDAKGAVARAFAQTSVLAPLCGGGVYYC